MAGGRPLINACQVSSPIMGMWTTRQLSMDFGVSATSTPAPRKYSSSETTQARQVTDGGTYFDYLGFALAAEIFAYGAGGFGSLQEYMILDDYYDQIRLDLIIWQFCGNDLHNNFWKLEASSWINNNRMTRPYLEDGTIVYRFPHTSWMYRNLLRHSVLVQFTSIDFGLVLAQNEWLPSELMTEDNPAFREAVATTRDIMRRVRQRAAATPIVGFSACGGGRHRERSAYAAGNDRDGLFADISASAGILYVADTGCPARESQRTKGRRSATR
jgi:hypothetical protein